MVDMECRWYTHVKVFSMESVDAKSMVLRVRVYPIFDVARLVYAG
jgi:hypothetical protein